MTGLVSTPIFEPNFEAVDSCTPKQKIDPPMHVAISSMNHLLQLNDVTYTRKQSGNGH